MKLSIKRKSIAPRIAASLLSLGIIVAGGYFTYSHLNPTEPAPLPVERATQQQTEEKGSQLEAIAEAPVRIMIDKIGVDASIQPVGLTESGMMGDPPTNELVGWYDKSAKAGEGAFAMLLDGHYGIGNRPGVFRRLPELILADTIRIQGEGGAVLEYSVVEIEQQYTDDVDMKKAYYPYKEGVQSLTIITCEGNYDAQRATYDKRTIVYAERVA